MGGSDRAEAGGLSALGKLPRNLERAVEQGFDINKPVYHGTSEDFTEFDPDRAIGTQFWSTTDRAAIEAGEVGAQGQGVIKEMYHNIKNPAGWKEYDNLTLDEMISRGYDGIALPEGDEITYIAFDPSQYRETDAKFLKKNIGKPDLKGQTTTKNLTGIAASSTALAAAPVAYNQLTGGRSGKANRLAKFKDRRAKRGALKQMGGMAELGLSMGTGYLDDIATGLGGIHAGYKDSTTGLMGFDPQAATEYIQANEGNNMYIPRSDAAMDMGEGLGDQMGDIERYWTTGLGGQGKDPIANQTQALIEQYLPQGVGQFTRGLKPVDNFNQFTDDLSVTNPVAAALLFGSKDII